MLLTLHGPLRSTPVSEGFMSSGPSIPPVLPVVGIGTDVHAFTAPEAGRPLCTLCGHPIDPDGHICTLPEL